MRRRGERLHSVPMRDIQIEADALLRQRPELIEEAAERIAAHPEKWLPKRALQTCQTGSAGSGTEKTQLFSTTSAIFRVSCFTNYVLTSSVGWAKSSPICVSADGTTEQQIGAPGHGR